MDGSVAQLLSHPSSPHCAGQRFKGYFPSTHATLGEGVKLRLLHNWWEKEEKTGSTDVGGGDLPWTTLLRTLLSAELELCLQRRCWKSKEHQCQAEGLGMMLRVSTCELGILPASCLPLGLGQRSVGWCSHYHSAASRPPLSHMLPAPA